MRLPLWFLLSECFIAFKLDLIWLISLFQLILFQINFGFRLHLFLGWNKYQPPITDTYWQQCSIVCYSRINTSLTNRILYYLYINSIYSLWFSKVAVVGWNLSPPKICACFSLLLHSQLVIILSELYLEINANKMNSRN